MLEDSVILYDFLVDTVGFHPENILIFGRSIGTGPATYLASIRKKSKLLILLSPYTNLKAVASDFVSILAIFFKDRFRNIDRIKNVETPLIIIHGKADQIIKVSHSDKLFEAAKMKNKRLIQPKYMTHNHFRLYDDLINPIKNFLKAIEQNKSYKKNIDSDNEMVTNFDSLCIEILQLYKSDYLHIKEKAYLDAQKIKKENYTNSSSLFRSSKKPKKNKHNPKNRINHSDKSKLKKKINIFENSGNKNDNKKIHILSSKHIKHIKEEDSSDFNLKSTQVSSNKFICRPKIETDKNK